MDAQIQEVTDQLEAEHWWFTARRRIIVRMAGRLLPEGGNVVDVGCGRGYVLAGMPPSWNRVGVDPSVRAIELGREKHSDLDLRVGLAPGAIEESLKEADLVLFLDVLEHVHEAKELFALVVREIPPGCQTIITVPAHMKLWSSHDDRHGHLRRYEHEDLVQLFKDLPVRPRLFAPLNRRLYPIVRLVRSLGRRSGTALGNADTDLFLPPRPVNFLLARIFEGETGGLLRALDAPGRTPKFPGVSWIAVVERTG